MYEVIIYSLYIIAFLMLMYVTHKQSKIIKDCLALNADLLKSNGELINELAKSYGIKELIKNEDTTK